MRDRKILAVRLLLVWVVLELAAATQVRTSSGRWLVGLWLENASRPVTWMTETVAGAGQAAAAHLASLRELTRENRELRRELELALARGLLLEGEVEALREALAALPMTAGFGLQPLIGRCLSRDISGGRLEVRTSEAVALDTPVVGAGGLIGRVVVAGRHTSWVELITHPAAAVAVQTTDGTLQAIAAGTGGHGLEVHYVSRSAPLVVDALLITSGADGVYPVGIPVATVTHVRERDAAFLEVRARPTAAVGSARVVLLLSSARSARWQGAVS